MPTSGPTNLPSFLSGNADFETWVQGVHNALVAVGMVQTTDTGQINPLTVARPAVNAFGGYEIWRFNDALQATEPVFFKLEYGVGAAVDRPALALTVGTGSSGAGAITGVVSARWVAAAAASKAAGGVLATYCSGGDGRLALATNVDFATTTFMVLLIVERTRDESGGFAGATTFAWASASATANWQLIPFGGVVTTVRANFPAADPGLGKSSRAGDLGLCPAIIFLGRAYYILPLVSAGAVDFPGGVQFSATFLGASHAYVSLTGAVAPTIAALTPQVSPALAIPWE